VTVLKRLAVTLLLVACAAAPAVAQPAGQAAPDGFEPVSALPAAEQLPAAPLVMLAYAFIWVAMLASVFMLWRRLGAVDRELAGLRQSIERQQ
jgi:hypothetical protein